MLDDGLYHWCHLLQEALVGFAGGRIGVDAHFALQGANTGMVDVQRAGAIVVERK